LRLPESAFKTLLAALVIAAAVPPMSATPMDQGMKEYKAGNYKEALKHFANQGAKAPADPTLHYYIGLCYQGLNQSALAIREFEWVSARAPSAPIGKQAHQALVQLVKYKSQTSPQAAGTALTLSQRADGTVVAANQTTNVASTASVARVARKLKVYDFYTDWCPHCVEFRPVFESVSTQMRGKAEFQSLNAEAPENSNLVSRFQVNSYPRVVITDDNGKVLSNERSYPDTAESLKDLIGQYLR
jgi:thioredoxin-like negative regulator of GroEL